MSRPGGATIIIPAYKPEHFRECLDSCLEQTLPAVRVVVSDDSPGPEIETAVRERMPAHPELFYSRNTPAAGVPANYVRPLSLARGRWIKYVDDDDELAPDCLQRLVTAAESPPDGAALAVGGYREAGPRGERTVIDDRFAAVTPGPEFLRRHAGAVGLFSRMLLRADVMSLLASRELPRGLLGFDRLTANMACLLGPVVHVPVEVCLYRKHGGNLSRSGDLDTLLGEFLLAKMPHDTGVEMGLLDPEAFGPWLEDQLSGLATFVLVRLIDARNFSGQRRFFRHLDAEYPGLKKRILTPRLARKLTTQFLWPFAGPKYRYQG
jgi:hypothetical protein